MSMPHTFDLSGKVALITGSSRGIGEAIARLLAAHGAHVIISSRKAEPCEAVAASIREAGGQASVLACHVGEMAQIDATFAAIEQQFGRLDILVNNAAANPYFGHISDTDVGAFQKT
ncbi:MAG TPA: SDR family NAD(P)-dependent oxidoreductase, partial [Aquabacterium sp.]|nr:SDR family NAD(P)-dependent oxidoreductase [Aquabacterium sp.]